MSAREHILRLQEELSKYQLLPSVQPSLQSSVQPSVPSSTSIKPTSAQNEGVNARQTDADAAATTLRRELQEITRQLLRFQANLALTLRN